MPLNPLDQYSIRSSFRKTTEPGPGRTWANILGLLVGVVFLSVPVLALLRMITE